MGDLYAVLGLERTASSEEIRSRYIELVLKNHPDRNPDKPDAEEMFKTISAAYSILGDSKNRQIYDSKLRINRDLFRQDKKEECYEDNWQIFLKNRREFNNINFSKINRVKKNNPFFTQNYQKKESKTDKQSKKERLEINLSSTEYNLKKNNDLLKEQTKGLFKAISFFPASILIYELLEPSMGPNLMGEDYIQLGFSLILGAIGTLGTIGYLSRRNKIKENIELLETNKETLETLLKYSS